MTGQPNKFNRFFTGVSAQQFTRKDSEKLPKCVVSLSRCFKINGIDSVWLLYHYYYLLVENLSNWQLLQNAEEGAK